VYAATSRSRPRSRRTIFSAAALWSEQSRHRPHVRHVRAYLALNNRPVIVVGIQLQEVYSGERADSLRLH